MKTIIFLVSALLSLTAHAEPRQLDSDEIINLKKILNTNFNETRWTGAYRILCDLDGDFVKGLFYPTLIKRKKALEFLNSVTEGEVDESTGLPPEYTLRNTRENESVVVKLSTDKTGNLKLIKINVLETFESNSGNTKNPSFETHTRIKETYSCYDQLI